MESLAAFHDEDWDSVNRMFFNDGQLDFMQQILHQFSFPPEHAEWSSFINPSTFCPNPEANMSIAGVSETLFCPSYALDSNFHYKSQERRQSSDSSDSVFVSQPNHETYFLSDSNHIAVTNDVTMSLDVSTDIAMGDAVHVIEDLNTDRLPKLDGGHRADNANELLLKRKFDVLEHDCSF